jgi:site-specific DNA recombinase
MTAARGGGRCFAYVRVSTVRQEQHGVSLDAQREAIERYAQRSGIKIIEWFTESQTAAKRGRKEFDRMLQLLRRSKAEGVVIHKIDRSARNLRDWADFAELVDSGISIHLAAEALDLTSRGGRLSADIQAVVAADFIRNLREETRKGFYGRLKQGLFPMRAPIGYLDNGGGQLKTIDPQKGPLVREMFDRYATGRYTLAMIVDVMRAAGLTNSFGNPLGKNAVAGMLRNPFYAGLITLRTTGEVFEGAHEALIPKSRFDEVQDALTGRSRPKEHRHEFAFRRLITCGLCGRVLIAERQKGHAYYRCHARGCPTTCVREEEIERAVADQLARITLTEEELAECYDALSWLEGATEALAREEVERLRLEVANVQDRLSRLADLLIDGTLDRETYEAKKRELLDRKLALEEQSRRTTEDPTWAFDEVREILELAKSPLLSFELAEPAEKRGMVEVATSNRTVSGKQASVELRNSFELIANRHAVPEGDPFRDVDRTFSTLSRALALPGSPRFAPTPNHLMVAELLLGVKEARGAGEAG